jgi:deoxyribonuclease V
LTKLSQETTEPIGCIVVDGYFWLEEGHQGLGYKLYEALEKKIPVVGVAKTFYKDAKAVQICRGDSKTPLYVTAEGMPVNDAAAAVAGMHGDYRLPTLLKLVDQTCRGRSAPVSK